MQLLWKMPGQNQLESPPTGFSAGIRGYDFEHKFKVNGIFKFNKNEDNQKMTTFNLFNTRSKQILDIFKFDIGEHVNELSDNKPLLKHLTITSSKG